jgi:hypothetical protein
MMLATAVRKINMEQNGADFENEDCGDDWCLAKKGIQLLLNNKIDEAEILFRSRKENVQMAAGHCFITFMVRCTHFNILIVVN